MLARVRGEQGQAGIAIMAALLALFAVFGLAVDGAAVVAAKVGLATDADAAAHAGAGAIDEAALAGSGTRQLDPAAADAAARAFAATACPDCTVSTVPGTAAITVTLQRRVNTFFLQIIGIRSATIQASATDQLAASP
jgi:hypothetical protein